MRAQAFAKINLSLRVVGARPDGYHELRTVFQSIALHDTLTIRSVAGPFRLTCDDRSLACDRTNLVWRAAERMWKAARRRGALRGLAIHLSKCIPVQAGLGGGSSDAAATLGALAKLWRVDPQCVRDSAVTLGADVPYFLEGGTVLGLERGDVLFPLIDRPRQWVVLVVPAFRVSTKDAYAWFDRGPERPAPHQRLQGDPQVARPFQGRDHRRSAKSLARSPERLALPVGVADNDLQDPVSKRYPEISRIVAALRRAGSSSAALSGSGSAVFGLFETKASALEAAGALERGTRRVIVTRTLTRAECRRLAAK